MKILFFGTSEFAAPSLKKILRSRHELAAVVTQPDRKRGRRLLMAPPPVKSALQGMDIPIYQPQDASSRDIISELKTRGADIFVVVSFGQILKKGLLEIPRLYCVNLHGSLLPKYRGAAPVNYAIMNGEETAGVTTLRMNEKMDGGDIILQRKAKILDTDTSETMNKTLSETGAELLMETIGLIESGKVSFTKQDEGKATYAPKLRKVDGLIRWSMPGRDIHNRVRGLIPWPGAYTYYKGKLLKIHKSECSGVNQKPETRNEDREKAGYIIKSDDNSIVVAACGGELVIKELQLEGGKRLAAGDFLRGHRLKVGDRFQDMK